MRNFLLGCCCGLFVGVIGATVALSGAQSGDQPWNPYAPGSFNSSTNLYMNQLDANTDAYLNQLKLQQFETQRDTQQFLRSFDEGLSQNTRAQRSAGDAVLQGLAEHGAAQLRALQAETDAKNRALDRLEREVQRMEMQNAIDRLNRGR